MESTMGCMEWREDESLRFLEAMRKKALQAREEMPQTRDIILSVSSAFSVPMRYLEDEQE
jgi:hypothetical protein